MDKINQIKNILKIGAIFIFTFATVIIYMVYKPNINITSSKQEVEKILEDNKKHLENAGKALGRI